MRIASQLKKRTLSKKKPCSHDMMTVGVQWIGQSTHAGQEKKRRTKRAQEDLREPSMATRCGTRGRGREKQGQRGWRGRQEGSRTAGQRLWPDLGSTSQWKHTEGGGNADTGLGGGGDSARSSPLHAHWCPASRSQSRARQPSPKSLSNTREK